ncbi:SDR family oxidoreductase [Ammoniphilus sp. YIM 78166]|uniref:SDR family oxidoreductase n=1 Tax=Ammoniphilus sp. YIM 78166 TaxID=1644106 RepID=UPI00106FA471|nr:SDR family oxidoreductase [Ammoniphilus sp. YIM 78166]
MNQKVALITGSATGLGKRTALELASRGVNIVLNYITSQQEARKLANYIQDTYKVNACAIRGDVSQYRDVQEMVQQASEQMGKIDIIVNNAGPYIPERKNMVDYEIEDWQKMIDGNLNSVFYLSKLVIPSMRQQGWGRIINIGFDRADTAPGWRFRSAFAAAKVGLVSLTKTLAIEEAEHGITVNMICPGDITQEYKEMSIEEVQMVWDTATPIGRPGTGEDVSRVVSFLCEPRSDFITGSIIQVTGGKDVLNKYLYEEQKE